MNDKNKKDKERYRELKKKGLCVLCGARPGAVSKLDGGDSPKFLKYCLECKQEYNRNRSEKRLQTKVEVLSHYGKNQDLKCCWDECEISDPDMLSLDHIHNGGNEERKRTTQAGITFYAKLKEQGYPEGFQTLCHNHQWKKEILRRRSEINGVPSWRK